MLRATYQSNQAGSKCQFYISTNSHNKRLDANYNLENILKIKSGTSVSVDSVG